MNSIEREFIDQQITKGISVCLFLVNGVKLQGKIVGRDESGVTLIREGKTQLIYRHAISTIMPMPES